MILCKNNKIKRNSCVLIVLKSKIVWTRKCWGYFHWNNNVIIIIIIMKHVIKFKKLIGFYKRRPFDVIWRQWFTLFRLCFYIIIIVNDMLSYLIVPTDPIAIKHWSNPIFSIVKINACLFTFFPLPIFCFFFFFFFLRDLFSIFNSSCIH